MAHSRSSQLWFWPTMARRTQTSWISTSWERPLPRRTPGMFQYVSCFAMSFRFSDVLMCGVDTRFVERFDTCQKDLYNIYTHTHTSSKSWDTEQICDAVCTQAVNLKRKVSQRNLTKSHQCSWDTRIWSSLLPMSWWINWTWRWTMTLGAGCGFPTLYHLTFGIATMVGNLGRSKYCV